MKIVQKINKSKFKDYIIGALVFMLCAATLLTLKIIENINFEQYIASQLNDTEDNNAIDVFSPDNEDYERFIGLSASKFINELELNFWEVIDDKEYYSTFQNGNGDTITVHYNEKDIIEAIDIMELD